MDHIISPKTNIHQPALITPRAPHNNEQERKHPPEEHRHHDDAESRDDEDNIDSLLPGEENPIGTKIDIQI